MKKKIILTPEELYYMGTLLQAKYIDYIYVAAMSDIQQNHEIYESSVKKMLSEKGILMEDFSGNMEVDANAKKLLEPIFLGEMESSIEIASALEGGRKVMQGRRFHFYEGRITATMIQPDGIHIEEADDGQLQTWIGSLLPSDYDVKSETISVKNIDRKKISRIIVVKSNKVRMRSAIEIYVEHEGKFLQEKIDGQAQILTREQFGLEIYRGVKGE